MPFVPNDKLYYHPFTKSQLDLYAKEKAQYDSSRVNVLWTKTYSRMCPLSRTTRGKGTDACG